MMLKIQRSMPTFKKDTRINYYKNLSENSSYLYALRNTNKKFTIIFYKYRKAIKFNKILISHNVIRYLIREVDCYA